MGADAEKDERDGFEKDKKPRRKRNERNYVPAVFRHQPSARSLLYPRSFPVREPWLATSKPRADGESEMMDKSLIVRPFPVLSKAE
jgi:hypothetical protein